MHKPHMWSACVFANGSSYCYVLFAYKWAEESQQCEQTQNRYPRRRLEGKSQDKQNNMGFGH